MILHDDVVDSTNKVFFSDFKESSVDDVKKVVPILDPIHAECNNCIYVFTHHHLNDKLVSSV